MESATAARTTLVIINAPWISCRWFNSAQLDSFFKCIYLFLSCTIAGRFCETCINDFYRPAGVDPADDTPCLPCNCDIAGSTWTQCVKVLSHLATCIEPLPHGYRYKIAGFKVFAFVTIMQCLD